ncbi:MAG: hypothetical protein JO257_30905 [Deltaproteobacteria bacterium]|nr:hypothetical protein [Deltaproteobacteria bacterium]
MRRELCLLALIPGCSLVLDFSDKAIPKDAMTDAPYTADECAYKEPNDSFDTAAVITTADTGPAALCADDPGDFYKITIAGATKVTFAIQFTNRPGGDLDLELLDSTGAQKSISRGFGDGETIVCPGAAPPCSALTDGDYIMRVFPAVQGAVNAYTFSVQVQ